MSGKKSKIILISAIIAIALAGTGIGVYAINNKKMQEMKNAVEIDTIYNGIKIGDFDVSGKNKEEAVQFLTTELTSQIGNQKVVIPYNDKQWEIPFTAFNTKYDVETAVNAAFEMGRSGSIEERYKEINSIAKKGVVIDLQYSYNRNNVTEELQKVQQELKVEPENSSMSRENGQFVITDEKMGYDLDVAQTAQKVNALVESKQGGTIEPVITQLEPKVKKADNEQATTLIGTYYTQYSSGAKERNENLKVGCANINGTLIAPGEVFSANESLGSQTYENGYKDAAVYVNGKVEQGVGGGVCQITTTLYNAAILAELEIVQRFNHSLSVAYVPLGMDSAIAGDYKDLRFKNNTQYPFYIEAYAENNRLVTNIYGHEEHDAGRKVEFEVEYIGSIPKPAEKVTKDPNMPEGERKVTYNGKTGSKVSAYKKVYENGNLISREWFCNSTYIATSDEVTVGTKPKTQAQAQAQAQAMETATPQVSVSENKKQETPKQETPKQETPKQETPKQETPKQETPKQETPKQETVQPEVEEVPLGAE